jgi:hypothetical protein
MSKGPGKWQRMILDALEGREWLFLWELLPNPYAPAEYSALMRAAHVLRRKGAIKIVSKSFDWRKNYLAAERLQPGEPPQVWLRDKISVENVPNCTQFQHLSCCCCGEEISGKGGLGSGEKMLCGECLSARLNAFMDTLTDDEQDIFSTHFRVNFRGLWKES